MDSKPSALSLFHPLVARWFAEHVGRPTPLQEQAWPKIASGGHVLITGPTGSGKTLAAFLWALNQLVMGRWPLARTSVLYVSPLKALNNDIRRNLLKPLDDLRRVFGEKGIPLPPFAVLSRSGDTPSSERLRMQRRPPEILITTPESLNLLLSSKGGRSLLTGLSTVILDEIHAVLENKRGTHLITAVDRLVPLSGEFQRIALSATVRPLEKAAEFVGGYRMHGSPQEPRYEARPVPIVFSREKKRYEILVKFPEAAGEIKEKENFWHPFVEEIKEIIERNRSTLIFTNSRRLCEKITHMINLGESSPIAYAHHGSLSREIRMEVERKLKAGDLRAIVATNSLELGIDIGVLDEVVSVQCPPTISSAIQRIGRAGHRVGEVSRGTLLPSHPMDILEAGVLAAGLLDQDIEPIEPVRSPLDVLAQVIVSMTGLESWDMDLLFAQLKTSYPYRFLDRPQFDLVLQMLAGRYSDSRIQELKPRLSIDRMDNTVGAKKGALQTLYFSGGTIPDRGYFHLRHDRTNAKIGELDEEFVWEAKQGQIFTLGTQNWKIERITHNDVLVSPADPKATAPPFWRAEEALRDFHFSEKIALFLEGLDSRWKDSPVDADLLEKYRMDETAARELISFLGRQKEASGGPLPHRHHLPVEFVSAGPGGAPGNQAILHTFWGGRVNRPFALALEAAWEERFGRRPETYVGNECIAVQLPHDLRGEELLSLVKSSTVQNLLKKRLEGSGFFGARFRECAGRALLLPRRKINERMPLWLSRLRSRKLLDAVLDYEDFPILLEAWRVCLRDEFDLESLFRVLTELETGAIAWSEFRTKHPSPMARSVAWQQVNRYVYMDDEPRGGKTSRLSGGLLREVLFSPALRPRASMELIRDFESKRMRLRPGYAPDTSRDLLDWVKERLLLPLSEWESLLDAAEQDHHLDRKQLLEPIGGKLVRVLPAGAAEPLIAPRETLPRILKALSNGWKEVKVKSFHSRNDVDSLGALPDTEEEESHETALVLGEWLRFYGPRTEGFMARTLGLSPRVLAGALGDLVDSETIVTGELIRESEENHFCDSENFEAILRIMRMEARPFFEPLDTASLPLFLSRFQGLTDRAGDMDGLFQRMEKILFYPALAGLWEAEILPARMNPYHPSWLDLLIQQSELQWIGCGRNRICFLFHPELVLMEGDHGKGSSDHKGSSGEKDRQGKSVLSEGLFPDPEARYDFASLLRLSGSKPDELTKRLWEAVWGGEVVNDTFATLRRGIETGFKASDPIASLPKAPGRRRPGGRAAFSRWKASLPFPGNWLRVSKPSTGDDLIDREERKKDRVRLLLDRYGILFREILQNELPPFRWSSLFRTLRLMELSGEVLTGYFFEGIPGPQFVSHDAFRLLRREPPGDAVWWISALDPASLCGIRLYALKGKLPRRLPGTHLVYCAKKLVMVSRGNGSTLFFRVPPEDPRLQEYLGVFGHLLTREFQPLRRIVVETINNGRAAASPFVPAFRQGFDVSLDYNKVVLYRSH